MFKARVVVSQKMAPKMVGFEQLDGFQVMTLCLDEIIFRLIQYFTVLFLPFTCL